MKKVFLALLLVVGITTFAQVKKGNRELKSPEERVEKTVAKMTKDLNLNDKQVTEIKALMAVKLTERQESRKDFKDKKESGAKLTSEERETRRKEMTENKAVFDGKMKSILTADQYKKWEQKKSENQEKMKERKSNRKGKK